MSALASENLRRQPRHHRALQLAEQFAHPLLHLLDRADMGERAAPELGRARHQKAVRRRANADHEHARAAAHGCDGVEQLLLVADRAVGQEHHLPHMAGGLRRRRSAPRASPAPSPCRRAPPARSTKLLRAAHMRGIRRHRVGEQHVHRVVEADHVEAVARLQPRRARRSRLAFACTIEVPPIEPELSITKITSRGIGFSCASSTGGGVMVASR